MRQLCVAVAGESRTWLAEDLQGALEFGVVRTGYKQDYSVEQISEPSIDSVPSTEFSFG